MLSKKHSKSRFVTKRNGKGFNGFNKKTTKPLPDTSRIPWFSPMKKTGMRT